MSDSSTVNLVRAAFAACLLSFLVAAAAPPAESSAATSLPRCAFGTDVAGTRGVYRAELEKAAGEYADGLSGPRPQRRESVRTFEAAAAAYVYGLPQVTLRIVVQKFLVRNTMLGVAKLATPQVRTVVAPNHDTVYNVAWIELGSEPLVLDVPAVPRERYYVLQILDAFTNAFGYVGTRATGTQAGSYALIPPGWQGSLPEGVERIDAPSNTLWLIGRTLVSGPEDVAAAKEYQQAYRLTPLLPWTLGQRQPSVIVDEYPPITTDITVPQGPEFIEALNESMAMDPPPARDACAVAALHPAGAGPSQGPAPEPSPEAVAAGTAAGSALLNRAGRIFNRRSREANNGWLISGPWIGRYARRYLARAYISRVGLGANVVDEAIYPLAMSDSEGKPLTGARRYKMTFPAGELPPVRSFWSMTMYGKDYFLTENEIDRYTIGDRTPGLKLNPDGSLTVFIQHEMPEGAKARANWLPAPADEFRLLLRLYLPKPRAQKGNWEPAPVEVAVRRAG